MSKITYLADLYKKSVTALTKNETEWKALLVSMSRFYKRSFDNAVLIHVQNPNATQLATFDEWHMDKINRSINKGAKGLAVIDMSNPSASFKHFFDLVDTNGTPESFKKALGFMWEVEDQYKPSLLIKFHDKYGASTENMETSIYELIYQKVEESLSDNINNFEVNDESSELYGMPAEVVREELKNLIVDSTYYMVASKTGLNAEIVGNDGFASIKNFGNLKLFMDIGAAIMSVAKPVLREINAEINNIKIKRSKLYEQRTISEPNLHRGQGRTTLPQFTNITKRTNRGGGEIREDVERMVDREPPTESIGTHHIGGNQPNNSPSGRGDGTEEREVDRRTSSSTTITRHGGYISESSPHGYAVQDSRGNRDTQGTIQNQISNENTESSADSHKKLSADGFFVIPKSKMEQENQNEIQRDTTYDLDEEEISDLVDIFLVSEDFDVSVMEWQSEIYKFISNYDTTKQDKVNIIKSFYGALDTSYTTEFGDYLEVVRSTKEGIYFERDGQPFTSSYEDMVDRIERLILQEQYPFSNEEVIDDFSIPDEIDQMQGYQEKIVLSSQDIIHEFLTYDDFGDEMTESAYHIFNTFVDFPNLTDGKLQTVLGVYQNNTFSFRTTNNLDIKVECKEDNINFHCDDRDFVADYKDIVSEIEYLISENQYVFSDEDIEQETKNISGNTEVPTREKIITDLLLRGSGTIGSKGRIQQAMIDMESSKDRLSFIKNEYGWYGSSGTTDGIHTGLQTTSKGLQLEYHTELFKFDEIVTWNEVGKRIYELALDGKYIMPTDLADGKVIIEQDVIETDDFFEQAEVIPPLVLAPFIKLETKVTTLVAESVAKLQEEPIVEQMNLYEKQEELATFGDFDDNDNFITGNEEIIEHKFEIGTRLYHKGRVLEVLDYLYDGKTVELGDIEQLNTLDTFKVRERVPVSSLADYEPTQEHYSDGELATLVVNAAESGDDSEETKEKIKAATIINQTDKEFSHNATKDFHNRLHDGTLNYQYSQQHRLYEGGAKTKCKANIEAIKLLKRLEEVGQHATKEQQIVLAGYVGWGGLANWSGIIKVQSQTHRCGIIIKNAKNQ